MKIRKNRKNSRDILMFITCLSFLFGRVFLFPARANALHPSPAIFHQISYPAAQQLNPEDESWFKNESKRQKKISLRAGVEAGFDLGLGYHSEKKEITAQEREQIQNRVNRLKTTVRHHYEGVGTSLTAIRQGQGQLLAQQLVPPQAQVPSQIRNTLITDSRQRFAQVYTNLRNKHENLDLILDPELNFVLEQLGSTTKINHLQKVQLHTNLNMEVPIEVSEDFVFTPSLSWKIRKSLYPEKYQVSLKHKKSGRFVSVGLKESFFTNKKTLNFSVGVEFENPTKVKKSPIRAQADFLPNQQKNENNESVKEQLVSVLNFYGTFHFVDIPLF